MFLQALNPYSVVGNFGKPANAAEQDSAKISIVETSAEEVQSTVVQKYVDLDGDGYLDIGPEEELSANFKYKELIFSDNAKKFGLENRVPASRIDIVESAKHTAKLILEPCRDQFGSFGPNSWYRGPEVEYAATYRDGFRKYIEKSYRRSNNTEPTAQELTTIVMATMFYRDLVKNAINSKAPTYSIILKLWDMYYAGKQHPNGEAVDFEIKGSKSNQLLFNWIRDNLKYDQLILEFHKPNVDAFSGWVHGSIIDETVRKRKNRQSAFRIG